MPDRHVTALVAAAGRGTRLGARVPKVFVPLRGRTLLERSVTAMVTAEVVDEIIVLASADMEGYAADLLARRGVLPDAGASSSAPRVRIVRTSVRAPGISRTRSFRHCSIAAASRPFNSATRASSAAASSDSDSGCCSRAKSSKRSRVRLADFTSMK